MKTFTLCVIVLMVASCSSGEDDDEPAIVAQPSTVPADARLIEEEFAVGADGGSAEDRRLTALTCADGLLTVATASETFYAELPCDRFATPEIVAQFQDVAVTVTVRPAVGEGKLIIESVARASLEFTIGHAWVEER